MNKYYALIGAILAATIYATTFPASAEGIGFGMGINDGGVHAHIGENDWNGNHWNHRDWNHRNQYRYRYDVSDNDRDCRTVIRYYRDRNNERHKQRYQVCD